MSDHLHTYLALGDSYTIGETLPLYENYPYQAVQLLRQAGHAFSAPEIIARTGWTTGNLQERIHQTHFQPPYDIVSLLIGVNNQYQDLSPDEYRRDFESLLQQAIAFAGNRPGRVFVLSIPDWSATVLDDHHQPNQQTISNAIDLFNRHNEAIAAQYGVHYLNITPGSRLASTDFSMLAIDLLHYSAKEYGRWAAILAEAIQKALQTRG